MHKSQYVSEFTYKYTKDNVINRKKTQNQIACASEGSEQTKHGGGGGESHCPSSALSPQSLRRPLDALRMKM